MDATSFSHAGCAFAYSTVGHGEPILWIQGTAVHGDGWMPQIEVFAAESQCIWFDNRGMFGSQPQGDAPITVEQMADDCRALLDHLEIASAHIVGHSLGGCIALQLALNWPERVRSLGLLCTAADGSGLVKMDAAGIWRAMRMQIGTKRSRRRAFMEIVLSAQERAETDIDARAVELEELFGHDLAVMVPGTMMQVGAMGKWDVTDRLGELNSFSTLVLGAECDPIAKPALMERLASGIPGARFEMFADCAHGVTVTRAAHVNEVLREHFDLAQ